MTRDDDLIDHRHSGIESVSTGEPCNQRLSRCVRFTQLIDLRSVSDCDLFDLVCLTKPGRSSGALTSTRANGSSYQCCQTGPVKRAVNRSMWLPDWLRG